MVLEVLFNILVRSTEMELYAVEAYFGVCMSFTVP